MVARYSDEYTSGLPSDYNGRYVKYDDYEELENEQERLRLEAGCMQATIDALTRKGIELQDELFRVKNESLKIVPINKQDLTYWEVPMSVILDCASRIYERYDSEDSTLVRISRWKEE